jgi:hypothetical protein
MELTKSHIATQKGSLRSTASTKLSTAEVIQLFALSRKHRFGFFEVVTDIVEDGIYYRPTSTHVRSSRKRKAVQQQIPFDTDVVANQVQMAIDSQDQAVQTATLKDVKMLLEGKILKGEKMVKRKKKMPNELISYLETNAPQQGQGADGESAEV